MLRLFSRLVPLVAALALAAPRPALAADPVTLEQFTNDVKLLGEQLREKKVGNEDLIGTLDALAKAFYNIGGPPAAPAAPAAGAAQAALDAHAAAMKKHEEEVKKHPVLVREEQDKALDLMVKALRLVLYNPRAKDNLRNDVNLKAAQVLGDVLSSADLAKCRDEKDVAKTRQSFSRDLMEILSSDFTKPKQEFQVPVQVIETTFAALGRMNQTKALEWMMEEYVHTRNAAAEIERLVAAHKAMKLFTNVEGKLRYAIAEKMITAYSGAEAQANAAATSGADAKAKSAAAAAKAFWDKVKTDAIAAVNYFATGPDGAVPQKADGQALTAMSELNEWWSKNNRPNKAPWVDPKPS